MKETPLLKVYTPESKICNPVSMILEIFRDLNASRELAWRLFVRDISAQYRQSFFGIIWAFLPPIILALGLTLAKNAKVFSIGATDLPYPAYVMLSMTLWQSFTDALHCPTKAIVSAKGFIGKVNFPREAIILSKLGEVLFNFFIKTILIIGIFIWFNLDVGWTAILAPFSLMLLIFLGLSFGMLIAPLRALYQDFSHALVIITGFWLFITPVIYPVPQKSAFAFIVNLNPVTPLLVTTRELATNMTVSNPTTFGIVSLITVVFLFFTVVTYRLALPFAIERFGS